MASDGSLMEWAAGAIAATWTGANIESVRALRGDLSTRRFRRLQLTPAERAPASVILVDLGPADLPAYVTKLGMLPAPPIEPLWILTQRFLSAIGVAVPELHAYSPAQRAMIVEDVGSNSLLEAARRPGADVADLFRLAVESLIRIHVEGTRKAPADFIPRSLQYDARLFDWELMEFRDIALSEIAPNADAAAIGKEITAMAATLGKFPRVLSHRDYHRENLFIQAGPRIRVIDFQDALMAPNAHDLAVLMTTRDTGATVHPALEDRILDFYLAGLARRGRPAPPPAEFRLSYDLCALQHALKMTGRFMKFAREGKPSYAEYVPHTIGQARRMLARNRDRFPALARALV
jgi:aminoglycoside/choline kinase family phosphotransferase